MLDEDYPSIVPVKDFASLECQVELPASWDNYFAETGRLPRIAGERRRFPRHRFRAPGAMKIVQSLSERHKPDVWYKIYAKDVSRGGLAFLHSEQLFPGERVQLSLVDGSQYVGRVRRSRRVGDKCYVVGVRFTEDLAGPEKGGSESQVR